jgi:hypothetical protein
MYTCILSRFFHSDSTGYFGLRADVFADLGSVAGSKHSSDKGGCVCVCVSVSVRAGLCIFLCMLCFLINTYIPLVMFDMHFACMYLFS